MVKVGIVNKSNNELPKYATIGSSGMDIRANIGEPIILKPFERRLIPTGIYVDLPEGYEIQVRPRSGLALKYGITVLNTPGTVDSGYRNEIGVILVNLSPNPFTIYHGDRIAQLVLARVERITEFQEVDSFEGETSRNLDGYGSSGVS